MWFFPHNEFRGNSRHFHVTLVPVHCAFVPLIPTLSSAVVRFFFHVFFLRCCFQNIVVFWRLVRAPDPIPDAPGFPGRPDRSLALLLLTIGTKVVVGVLIAGQICPTIHKS